MYIYFFLINGITQISNRFFVCNTKALLFCQYCPRQEFSAFPLALVKFYKKDMKLKVETYYRFTSNVCICW